MALTYRLVKGAPLTFKEGDDNLTYLQNLAISASISASYAISSSFSTTASYAINTSIQNVVEKTKAQIDTLINSNLLTPGQLYKITGVDTALYGGTDIFIKAATTNKLELAGHGIFYNPKYLNSQLTPYNGFGIWYNYITIGFYNYIGGQSFTKSDTLTANNGAIAIYLSDGIIQWVSGDWSTATTATNGTVTATIAGVYSSTPSYSIGQNVIWGGKHWVNTSGNVGTSIDKYTLSPSDWTEIPFNDVDYNVQLDIIHYDYLNDKIIRRKDRYDNDVDGNWKWFYEVENPDGYGYGNPIKDFQWGNYPDDFNTDDYWYLGTYGNSIKDSYFDCLNFVGNNIAYNNLTKESTISGIISNYNAYISHNNLDESFIANITMGGPFGESSCAYNFMVDGAIGGSDLCGSRIDGNTLNGGQIFSNILRENCNISGNTLIGGSYIYYNTLRYSNINLNNLDSSTINYNNFTYTTVQNNNMLASNIEYASLSGVSTINRNNLKSTLISLTSSGTLNNKNIDYIEGNLGTITANISAATIIYGNYTKQIFTNSAGTTKLGYYNASNVFTVVNVNV